MERYKSIFTESNGDKVASEQEAMQIVDISSLKWSKSFGPYGAYDAKKECPSGYRLPTIQELYTAYVQKVPNFKQTRTYWSGSAVPNRAGNLWSVSFYNSVVSYSGEKFQYLVKYVKI